MASQVPYEESPGNYPESPPHFEHADWVNGEQILSGVPAGETDIASTWYFSRWIELEGGVYTFKGVTDDIGNWFIGPGLGSMLNFANTYWADGKLETQVYLPRGLSRFDIHLHNTGGGPSMLIFSLFKDGKEVYHSEAEYWLIDRTPIPDTGLTPLPDPRLSLPVWSILPNWKDGMTERLTWVTDLLESEDGAEQRRAIRVYPRRSLEASFWKKGADRTRIDNFALTVGKDAFLVPLWHEQVKTSDGITAGSTGLAFGTAGTALREFRVGDICLVTLGNPGDYDLLVVGEVEPMRIGWLNAPYRDWPPGTRVFPCRLARLIDAPQITARSVTVSVARVRFDLVEPDFRQGAWPQMLEGKPLFPYVPDRAQEITFDYGRNTYTLDNNSSIPYIYDTSRRTKGVVKITMQTHGRAETTELRNMLAAMRGRQADFYCPTFMQDIYPVADIEANPWIDLQAMGFAEYQLVAQPIRSKIVIMLKDGTRLYRNIVDIFEVRDDTTKRVKYERFYLDTALPELSLSEVGRISFVSMSRLDQDAVELYHPTAASKVVQVSLIMREVVNNREE